MSKLSPVIENKNRYAHLTTVNLVSTESNKELPIKLILIVPSSASQLLSWKFNLDDQKSFLAAYVCVDYESGRCAFDYEPLRYHYKCKRKRTNKVSHKGNKLCEKRDRKTEKFLKRIWELDCATSFSFLFLPMPSHRNLYSLFTRKTLFVSRGN